jgi:hypothetical protein
MTHVKCSACKLQINEESVTPATPVLEDGTARVEKILTLRQHGLRLS